MRLITSGKELNHELMRLVEQYPSVSFAVAWASIDAEPLRALVAQRDRIAHAVIGTHFYQTHPAVLDAFVGVSQVRCVQQPSGVFHPKIYVFWSDTEWEGLIGSANLTVGALTTNTEAMLLVNGRTSQHPELPDQVRSLVHEYWREANPIELEYALAYRRLWEQKQPVLQKLAGQYGAKATNKPPVASSVITMSWAEYLELVMRDPHHGYEDRCALLEAVHRAFERTHSFASMDDGMRRTVAGIPGASDEHWPWFGSMKGAGYYKQAIIGNNPHIAAAIDLVPLHGQVTRSDYDAFVREFRRAFPSGGDGVAVATRLLALKRPDQFVCLDAKNRSRLCESFGITSNGIDYARYWTDVVERILDSVWWNAPRPTIVSARRVYDGRAAMLDAIFYDEA